MFAWLRTSILQPKDQETTSIFNQLFWDSWIFKSLVPFKVLMFFFAMCPAVMLKKLVDIFLGMNYHQKVDFDLKKQKGEKTSLNKATCVDSQVKIWSISISLCTSCFSYRLFTTLLLAFSPSQRFPWMPLKIARSWWEEGKSRASLALLSSPFNLNARA